MSERRTLHDALALDETKAAFIESGTSRPMDDSATQQPTQAPTTQEPSANEPCKPRTDSRLKRPPARPFHGDRTKTRPRKSIAASPTPQRLTTPVVSITTRYHEQTAEALRRASLERKLAGKHPSTQQEMVESAVSTWLEKNGYAIPGKS